jgi:hypothetical protein
MDILFFLLLGHFIGDYAFQSDKMAEKKKSSIGILTLHILLYTLAIWITFFFYSIIYQRGLFLESSTLLFLIVLFIQHWVQDFIKGRGSVCSKQVYYLDQAIHLVILYLYRIFFYLP